ncbi:enoyl-CoA hydratase/isomerase family protein [Aurantiacibacter xanthus]|uniref:3-hydroxyisobutyryl-CoA hydrolase n=1 Tax=Aurantiacibacter xanthus TaxID=1784712 RepID=A0A3A1PA72_9SPHN|nr:enoyl-CoA hydratase/isomerase family protein [Aurantiacibacter xanthus]RIV90688.1 enoyl-CoA hydratase/isomerase family protein [Aurantiacibacter xanthus]
MTGITISREGQAARLSLSRGKALNAMTREMCEESLAALLAWRSDDSIAMVMIDHAGERGFCAGGDVAAVRRSVVEGDGIEGRAFFLAEYRLNHLLFAYPKPVVTFMDGVTMGGGVGISLPAKFRVATENTLFAMPEGAIGLFPDAGAGYTFARLPGRLGQFLALTGARLDGGECLWAGLATHYLESAVLEDAKARIAEQPEHAEAILDELSASPPPARLAGNAENIARHFASDRLEEILASLAADDGKWAGKELAAVSSKCPTTSKVALRLLAEGAQRDDFAEEMAREYAIVSRMITRPDFAEGVRAVLIDKDKAPRWNPARPEDVSDEMLDALFAPLPEDERWTPAVI